MIRSEAKRPVEQIPAVGDDPSCPAHPVKIEYCPNNSDENEENWGKKINWNPSKQGNFPRSICEVTSLGSFRVERLQRDR